MDAEGRHLKFFTLNEITTTHLTALTFRDDRWSAEPQLGKGVNEIMTRMGGYHPKWDR